MEKSEKIDAFVQLGDRLSALTAAELDEWAGQAQAQNGWFSRDSVSQSIQGICHFLSKERLEQWLLPYKTTTQIPKIVGVIMAGNIPLVGFHDLLCVLLSGNFAAIKPSSSDRFLMGRVIESLTDIEPRFKKNIEVRDKLTQIDAVIATGSDNTARYFEYYFKDVPSIIRKNRTSVAIIEGSESSGQLEKLGQDVFQYYGLGCRNVSKVFTPEGYDIRDIFPHWESWEPIIHHHKYRNNYDYYKSIFLVNKTPHLDTGFLLIQSSDELVSPTSVLYHQAYEDKSALDGILKKHEMKIQCVVANDQVPFGKAQTPDPWDYADHIDTMQFLTQWSEK